MKTAIYIAIISCSLINVACGGSSSARRVADDGEAGEAGETSVPVETGGSSTGAVASTGGSGGTDLGGSGGAIDPIGGAGGEPETGGTGNVGGVCIPKTCLTHAVEATGSNDLQSCDLIDDGCGNYIDCGECPSTYSCGGGSLNEEPFTADGMRNADEHILDDGIPNICNGGCKYIHRDSYEYVECPGTTQAYACAYWTSTSPVVDSIGRPLVNCERASGSFRWCCDVVL